MEEFNSETKVVVKKEKKKKRSKAIALLEGSPSL